MNGEVVKKRGRPATIDKKSVFELLERHIEDIFHEQSDALVGKSQLIWTTLAREFQHRILPSTIYTYACEFKKELKSNQDEGGAAEESHLSLQSDANSTVNEANSTINNSSLVFEDQKLHLEIPLEKSVFMAMTERCKVKCAGRRGGYRNKVRFIPGKYTDTIFEKIFAETSLRCAFMISDTHVAVNYNGGYIKEPPDKTSVEFIDSNRSPMLAEQTTEKCPACKDKLPFPRKCATPGCQAGIHHMMECSYPLNPGLSDEGYNQERICRNCFFERPVKKTSKRKKPTESARGKPDSNEAIIEHVPEKSKKRGKYDSRKEPPSMSSFNRNDVSDGDDDDDYYDDKGDDKGDDEGDDDYRPVVKKRKGDDGLKDDDDDDSEDDNNNMPLPSKKKVQANRDYENWMGQVDKTKSKALYLGGRKEELKDAIKFKKSHQIVTLKNGNLCGKKPIQIKGEKIYISNTCAFDSIAQLLYISICDDANLRDKIAVHEDEFLEFILYLYNRGIENDKKKDETYKKRAEILLEICALPIMKEKTDMFGIQAAHNVVGFASALTKKISTIHEIRRCSEMDCPSKQVTRPLKTLQLKDTQLADPNFHNLVESPSLVSNICNEGTCIGESTGFVRAIGDILLVEVISSQDPQMMSQAVSLRNIPKRVLSPTGDGTELRLLGAIAYTGPARITSSRQHQISHYTAVCLRNDWWYEFDDKFPLRKKNRSDGAKIVPELLIYSPLS